MTCRLSLRGHRDTAPDSWGPVADGAAGLVTYRIHCRGDGRCDQCPAGNAPELCDDPLLRALKQGCPGYVTDLAHAELPYPCSCLSYMRASRACPLAVLHAIT